MTYSGLETPPYVHSSYNLPEDLQNMLNATPAPRRVLKAGKHLLSSSIVEKAVSFSAKTTDMDTDM
jgi:hypothetical protein